MPYGTLLIVLYQYCTQRTGNHGYPQEGPLEVCHSRGHTSV